MEWKQIPNTNYYVSDDGKIRKPNGNLMKGSISSYGYHRVTILHKEYLIHRLVAQAFIPNPNNLPQVNHRDGNKLNNTVANLEWCDNYYNYQHAVENGLRPQQFKKGEDNINAKLTKQDIQNIRNNPNITPQEISKLYHIDITNAYKIYNNTSY